MLMASVLIAALGAVMDVGMSVAASLEEIHTLNPALNARALMGSGMRIGRDLSLIHICWRAPAPPGATALLRLPPNQW